MGNADVVPEIQSKPEEENGVGQGRSTIKFPYLDQDDAVEIACAIQRNFGRSCSKDQLAGHFRVKPDAGGFSLRTATAKLYGLIDSDKGSLSLTALGVRICDPQYEKPARVDSFLLVPLYKKIYDDFKGQMLPSNTGLEAHLERSGVAPKQKDKARQVFQRSATQSGFFAYGTNRLVLPHVKSAESVPSSTGITEVAQTEPLLLGGGGGGNDGGNGKSPFHQNPFIQGLLSKLPPENTNWSTEGRKKWLQTAASIFDLVYTSNDDDSTDLRVTVG